VAGAIYNIADACNFKQFILNFTAMPINNILNNIYNSSPKLLYYILIFGYGVIFNSKYDIGEALGVWFSGITGVYRPV
jgi:hypothetical protein